MTNQEKHNKEFEGKKSDKIETTGHEWDGISEYNVPAPRWWLIVWIICIIWSVIYWFFYPSWPTKNGNLKGSLDWTKQLELQESQKEIDEKKSAFKNKISKLSLNEIKNNKELTDFAINGGRAIFKENCSACHGFSAEGRKGFPNLNDDDWLWGGRLEDIYYTIKYGIRSTHDQTRFNQMPAFGKDKILNKEEINAVAEYVMSLSDLQTKTNSENLAKGETIFKANCVSCHGQNAKGNITMGAPNLTDAIWLYGNKKEDIITTIHYARNGVMPYWKDRFDDETIKQLSIYIYSLGGGK